MGPYVGGLRVLAVLVLGGAEGLMTLDDTMHHELDPPGRHGGTAFEGERVNGSCVWPVLEAGDAISSSVGATLGAENASANCRPPGHAPKFASSTMIRVVTLSLIAAVSLVGNIAILVSIYGTHRQSRSTIYLLIAQLAIADLLVTLFCVVAEAIWTYTVQWLAGEVMCKVVKFLQMFALYLSTFILVVIGFDRFSAVRFPMRRANAKRKVKRLVIVVWVLSCLFSLPQMAIFRVMRGPFVEEFYQCVTYGFYTAQWQEQLYTTVSLVLMFLLPLVILISTYICTFYTISRKEHIFANKPRTVMDDARRKLLRKAKMKALMITFVIVMAFVVCWTPYYSMMIFFIFWEPDEQLSEELQAAIFFFGSSTAMINPIIYGAFHLHRRPTRTKTVNNSSASSRGENTVMLVTFRRSKGQANNKNEETETDGPRSGFHISRDSNSVKKLSWHSKSRNGCCVER